MVFRRSLRIRQNLTVAKTPELIRWLACAAGLGDVNDVRAMLGKSPKAVRDWRPIMEASY